MCKWKPEKGERILVSNGYGNFTERIFLEMKDNKEFICVCDVDEPEYLSGEHFCTRNWKYAKPIEPVFEPKRGQIILVSGDGEHYSLRVFIRREGLRYITVSDSEHDKFFSGEKFGISGWSRAKPVPEYAERVFVKPIEEIIQTLKAEGFKIDIRGDWNPLSGDTSDSFLHSMFYYCGKEKPTGFSWKESWLVRK